MPIEIQRGLYLELIDDSDSRPWFRVGDNPPPDRLFVEVCSKADNRRRVLQARDHMWADERLFFGMNQDDMWRPLGRGPENQA